MTRWDLEPGGGWDAYLASRERYLGTPWRRRPLQDTAVPALIRAWNAGDAEGVAACYAPDALRHGPAPIAERLVGRERIELAVADLLAVMPGCRFEVADTLVDGARVALEWRLSANPHPDVPRRPRRGAGAELAGLSLLRLDGALIAEERLYAGGSPPAGGHRTRW